MYDNSAIIHVTKELKIKLFRTLFRNNSSSAKSFDRGKKKGRGRNFYSIPLIPFERKCFHHHIPMARNGKPLRRAEERQRSIGEDGKTVYVAHGREFRPDASHGFWGEARRKERKMEDESSRHLLEHEGRVALRGAEKGDRAVVGRSKTPRVVDRREFRPHAPDRLWLN